MTNPARRLWTAMKAATAKLTMRWTRGASWATTWLGSTQYDYATAAGDGRGNAAVMACIRWVQRALPEAPLVVIERNSNGELSHVPEHPLQERLDSPNPYYSGLHLMGALVADLMLTGNAYIRKVRSGQQTVAELWWIPASQIEPRWADDGSEYIGWYEYAADGIIDTIPVEDIVHIRQGFDPQNTRKGLSDLTCLLREIATDNEAANWSASMVRNVNPPGVVISPASDAVGATDSDLEEVKAKYKERFGGDNRGEPLVMKGPTKVDILSFSPEQMNLRSLRQIPEERITAVFGIPAAVVGLGTGLEQTKVGATMSEQREQAYESCLIPMQRLISAELQMQLVPDFGNPTRLRVEFDLSDVRVLQDDQNALHQRAREDMAAGLLTLNQALQMIGEDPVEGEAGDVRFIPNSVTVKTLDTLIPDDQPAELTEPTPLRALPAPADDAAKARQRGETKALSDDDLIARFEAGLTPITEDLADELMGAFEDLAETALSRYQPPSKGQPAVESKADDAIDGLVTEADHEPIKRLLRVYVLKSMRQAAEDLAPLTGGTPMRIQRNTPAVKEAVAAMESRIPGIAAKTGEDFGRLIRRLERRPGSVSIEEVRSALIAYIEESYPSRAETIARTELGYGHQAGTLHVIEKVGLSDRVTLHDGDGDPSCRARNGTTLTIEEARGVGLLHPNCRLAITPLIEEAA